MATHGNGHAPAPKAPPAPPAPSPLDAPIPTKRMVFNMGPSHPATHGVTKFIVELDGETVTDGSSSPSPTFTRRRMRAFADVEKRL